MIGNDIFRYGLDLRRAVDVLGPLATRMHPVTGQPIDAPEQDWRGLTIGEFYQRLWERGWEVTATMTMAEIAQHITAGTLPRRTQG